MIDGRVKVEDTNAKEEADATFSQRFLFTRSNHLTKSRERKCGQVRRRRQRGFNMYGEKT